MIPPTWDLLTNFDLLHPQNMLQRLKIMSDHQADIFSCLCCSVAPWQHCAAQSQRRHGSPDVLRVPDPAVPLHVLEVQPTAGGSSLRCALSHASALQPGKPADSGSTDLLVFPASEESKQTLPEREESSGQRGPEGRLTSQTKWQISSFFFFLAGILI